MMKTYAGSCHCGAVRFEADIDFSLGTWKCNCSICTKARFWHPVVMPEAFRLLEGESALTEYQFNARNSHHMFCKHCGVHTFGWAEDADVGGKFYTPKIACLDNLTREDIEVLMQHVIYVDGRNDNFHSQPPEIRHL